MFDGGQQRTCRVSERRCIILCQRLAERTFTPGIGPKNLGTAGRTEPRAHQVERLLLGGGAVQRQVAHVQPPLVVLERADARQVRKAHHRALARRVQQVVSGLIVDFDVRNVYLACARVIIG